MNNPVKIYNLIDRLRKAIRREGTPAVQEAWDNLEPHAAVLMRGLAAEERK
ncbi:MAG: hypothetical protein RI906_3345 [Pseudomonadota bacterium]|jgi:hypothetical protein